MSDDYNKKRASEISSEASHEFKPGKINNYPIKLPKIDLSDYNHINFNKDIDCSSTSSTELFSLASSYSAKEYLPAVVTEKLLFLLNFVSLF